MNSWTWLQVAALKLSAFTSHHTLSGGSIVATASGPASPTTYDDAIVRLFFIATVTWALVGMLVGVMIALELAWWPANMGIPQLSVGTIERDYPGDQWHYINARIVNTARAYGLQAIDGPYAQIRDLEGFTEVARRSRLLGMDGKWALHPDQIGILNELFSPAQKQFDLAVAILDAYRVATEDEGKGAVMFRGEMIDEASRKMALQVEAAGRAAGMTVSDA